MTEKQSIAVVGSGISGLSAAWLLAQKHNVTLFEREPRPGGHSNTVEVAETARTVPVDTGFIVYNTASYPNLIALFDHLGVQTAPTNMGFSVSLDGGSYEYSGSSLGGLIGHAGNVIRADHWRMISDLLRFFREACRDLPALEANGQTLGDYLAAKHYSEAFVVRHILPMAAAIWSTPSAEILQFPAAAFVRFFDNHGLLKVSNRPEWRTVVGGSREYVRRILQSLEGKVRLGTPVQTISRDPSTVTIRTANGSEVFDACVVATHADDALALLSDADGEEHRLLGAFQYTNNLAVLHSDRRLMPKRRRLWTSWNYLGAGDRADRTLAVSYWMNTLQPLETEQDYFVTLNPPPGAQPESPLASFQYTHPMFDQKAMAAQRSLWDLQGRRRTWFCGSYFGSGFHEDGLQSGLAAAEHLGGVRRPWTVANESGRIFLKDDGKAPRAPALEAAE